ncbi:rod shape-determining protein [Irregularibacter muris]|uniref:Cell shape-determining protein MreB n=1 Tax=Irregularibacter muris TaxID=1796619 RepID=A0AAE3HFF2_9FIRM|nr:rod shape-determining protein [Irregularibacter muris]MCR1898505.1 rod shape-determining protein [Irregularibacter muris]
MCPKQIAIDFGTSNTLIYIKGRGLVLQEPSVVAINKNNDRILAVGFDAQRMIGKTPVNIQIIKPLKYGSINHFDIAKVMLQNFIEQTKQGGRFFKAFSRAEVLVGVPSGITQVERRGIEEVIKEAGARKVMVVKSVVAAAIGSGASINKPKITFVVDVGGGTTDVAAITLGGILVENSIKVGGNSIDEAIIHYLKKKHNINIGEITAENIKIKIGDAIGKEEKVLEVTGQNLTSGLPILVNINSAEIFTAIKRPLDKIVAAIKKVIEQCPPESAADILENGVVLTGGGSLLNNFDTLLRNELGIKVTSVEQPLIMVTQGLGITLDHLDLLDSMMLEYSPRDIQNKESIIQEDKDIEE